MSQACSVTTDTRDGVEIVTIRDGATYAEIAPSLGNNCFSFVAGVPVLEPVAFDEFLKKPTSYGIPIMVPFPNRIRDGRFTFKGETYTIDPPRHGMVRDKPWTVVETGASEGGAWVTSRLDASDFPDRILNQFPFPFRVDVTYGLVGRTLDMVTVVENTGDGEMPFGFGIHPYFRRPAHGSVRVPAQAIWELENFLPTARLIPVEEVIDLRTPVDLSTLEVDEIYTSLIADDDGLVTSEVYDADNGTRLVVQVDPRDFPHSVVYTTPAPRQGICIEPQTCPTDSFNLTDRGVAADMIVLAPGETRRFTIRIRG